MTSRGSSSLWGIYLDRFLARDTSLFLKFASTLLFFLVAFLSFSFSEQKSQAAGISCYDVKRQVLSAALSQGDIALASRASGMCSSPCDSIGRFYETNSLITLQNGAYLESRVLQAYRDCLASSNTGGGGNGGGGDGGGGDGGGGDGGGGGPVPGDCSTYSPTNPAFWNKTYLDNSSCLEYQTINGLSLTNVEIVGVDFTGVKLNNAYITNTTFTGGSLKNAKFSKGSLTGSFLDGVDISGLDLSQVSSQALSGFGTRNLIGKPKALPTGWKLVDGYFVGPGANLFRADFSHSNLSYANLSYANLNEANLKHANIQGARLSFASLDLIKSGGIKGQPSDLPYDWVIRSGLLLGPTSDLAGVDISKLDLWGCNLISANLDNAKGKGIIGQPNKLKAGWKVIKGLLIGPRANLTSTDLSNLDLTGANLSHANLTNATISNSNLTNANLSSAKLIGLRGLTVKGSPKLPKQWAVVSNNLVGPNAKLSRSVFNGGDFSGVSLVGTDLSESTLSGLKLGSVDFSKANLTAVKSSKLSGTPTLPLHWQMSSGYLLGPKANLSGANLSKLYVDNANLNHANLSGANISNAHIKNSDLSGVNFTRANLSGSTISATNIQGSKFKDADLSSAQLITLYLDQVDLRSTKLTDIYSESLSGRVLLPKSWGLINGVIVGATGNGSVTVSFSNQDISGIDLSKYDLSKSQSGGVTGIPKELPSGWDLVRGYFVGPGANLRNADLGYVNFDNRDLSKANFQGANLGGATFRNAKLTAGDFSNSDLSGARFTNSDLTGAVITGAKVSRTDFSSATTLHLRTGLNHWDRMYSNANFAPKVPAGWQLIISADYQESKALIIGPGVDLGTANLAKVTINDARIDLSGVDFTHATMSETLICNVFGDPVLPPDWVVKSHWKQINWLSGVQEYCIVGPGARFPENSLSGFDLDGVNMSNISLRGVLTSGFTGTPSALATGYVLLENCGDSGKCIVGPRIRLKSNLDFAGRDLSGVNFTGVEIGQGSSFANANLQGANFTNSSMNFTDFTGSNLQGANFSYAVLNGSNFNGADFSGAIFEGAHLVSSNFTNADMAEISFKMVNSEGSSFINANLKSSVWSGSYFGSFDSRGGNLINTDFSGSDLSYSSFWNCFLISPNFTDTDRTGVFWSGTEITR